MSNLVIQELRISAPILRGAAFELGSNRDIEVCLDGPAGTGKTYAALYKVHTLLLMFPGAKALVARKTNTALAGSAIATYREMLDPNEGVTYFGGNKIKPAAFEYPNGSQLIVNGLDKREKIKSWEFDIAYINEATECEEDDVQYVRSRLRHGKIGYHQLIMDCNPDAPEHWLNLRMNEGVTTRLISKHEDNPRYFDTKTNDWTPEGYDYIFVTLAGLTGVLLDRLRWGIWSAAHGIVYQETWDRKRNVVDRFPVPKEWSRWIGVDFGFTNPFVCKWYAMDPDGRLYVYREIYRTQTLVEDHAKEIKRLSHWGQDGGDPLPREIICDTDAEDRATLERHLGLMTMPAHKTVSDGIQAVASRLRPAGDGKPRLLYFRDCLVERDPALAKIKKPASSLEEFNVYIWDTRAGMKRGEQPVKEYDHGMDVDRYMVARFDLRPTDIKYSARIY